MTARRTVDNPRAHTAGSVETVDASGPLTALDGPGALDESAMTGGAGALDSSAAPARVGYGTLLRTPARGPSWPPPSPLACPTPCSAWASCC